MDQPPPPPPPHGDNPKTTSGAAGGGGGGLGPGNYDIFIIPQRDKGGGFIYLPAMNANGPSFAAGFACALVLVVLFQSMAPAFQTWWRNFEGMGSTGMFLLIIAVGLVAWAMGQWQAQAPAGSASSGGGAGAGAGTGASYGAAPNAGASSPPPPPPPRNDAPPNSNGNANGGPKQQSWQQQPPPPGANARTETPPPPPPPPQPEATPPPPGPSAWEKARQETKRKEEERKKKEEDDRRKADAARRLREFREKEARERERREKEARERKEKAEREEREKEELRQRLQKETAERERLEKEKADREAREKEEALRKAREAEEAMKREEARKRELEELRRKEAEERLRRETETAARTARQGSTYAYSGVGEKTNPWPKGTAPTPAPASASASASASGSASARAPAASSPSAHPPPPPASASASASASAPKSGASPTKPPRSTASSGNQSRRPPGPSTTTRTHLDPDEDAYSYRPYDQHNPRRSHHGRAASSVGSESSWAPSATTAHTTPPPSMRAPYTTKDPDKIVIKAVYLFMNQFAKTPASNLLSGVGAVTDGLILRVTTAGLFIDDDVRGVPQREWDVKAWTLKSVEVWCPQHCLLTPSAAGAGAGPQQQQPTSFLHKMAASQFGRAAERGAAKSLTGDDAEAYLTELHRSCRDCCRLGLCDGRLRDANVSTSAGQTGAWKARGLHVVRATIRDQESKRYLFVLDEEEAWKVAAGLQRLRKGTQARAVGVSGMTASEARSTLDLLGWLG